ncbi:MAG: DivIVA domain-containing protein [Bacteroidota bacterium]
MITPIEIRQQTFKKSMRGYDKEEVQAFLNALAQEWEEQLSAMRSVKEERDKVQSSYNTLKEVENMLHKTLMQAEQSSRDTLDNARQKAELKLQEAEVKAQEIIRKGIEEKERILKDIEEMSRKRDQLLVQLQGFLKTQLEFLDTYQLAELPPAAMPKQVGPISRSGPRPTPSADAVFNGQAEQIRPQEVKQPKPEMEKSETVQEKPANNGKAENFFMPSKNGKGADFLDDIMSEL